MTDSPFEAVDVEPLAVSLPDAGVMVRPPATALYAGSTFFQYSKASVQLFIGTVLLHTPKAKNMEVAFVNSRVFSPSLAVNFFD